MRNLEEIENELAQAHEEAENVSGTPAEVYSRIVGYYRSVRNWNKGKREEYGERKLFNVEECAESRDVCEEAGSEGLFSMLPSAETQTTSTAAASTDARLMLFVRPHCPACPGAKAAAGKLGIPVDMVDADTDAGFEAAQKMNVFSTPTAILLASDGSEILRARDAGSIAELLEAVA